MSNSAHTTPISRPQAEDLKQAFHSFEQISEQLSGIYQHLEEQVHVLNHELSASREDRERQLLEKERLAHRLASLLDALPGGVVVLDGKGIVQECNPAARELLGEPLQGVQWREVVERSFSPRWDDGHDISLVNGARVNISTQSLQREPGQILLLKDVTETRRLQDQLGAMKRLSVKGEMAAALAHQVRTPLSSALLYASNLTHSANNPERLQQTSEKLIGRLRHLERLVEEMLLFARGGQSTETEIISLDELLTELKRHAQVIIEERPFSVTFPEVNEALFLKTHRDGLISALNNLIDNASQACGEDGRLDISLESGADTLTLRFADNGPGVPVAMQSDIFEPFVTTRSGGTGLGLAIVNAVVTAHGGQLSLDSSVEQGACFVITLPLVAHTPEQNQNDGEIA